jgi:hypothetical protein
MRLTSIITAKIKPGIYRKIESGEKTLEVRDDDYGFAEAIRYVSSIDGHYMGTYRIDGFTSLPAATPIEREIARKAACVSREEFTELFPVEMTSGAMPLDVALIGERIDDYQQLFQEEES